MEAWPDIAKRRAPSLPEPRPIKKTRRATRHWLMKLALVLEKTNLPEAMEKLIETFLLQPRHRAFRKRYGENLRTINAGCEGWLNGWHPTIRHDRMDRWLWFVFHRITLCLDTDVTAEIVQPLQGKRAIVEYQAKDRPIQIPARHVIRIVYAGPTSMRVDDGNGREFTLAYRGVLSISLHVEFPRQAS
jgi:hypothetical protein